MTRSGGTGEHELRTHAGLPCRANTVLGDHRSPTGTSWSDGVIDSPTRKDTTINHQLALPVAAGAVIGVFVATVALLLAFALNQWTPTTSAPATLAPAADVGQAQPPMLSANEEPTFLLL